MSVSVLCMHACKYGCMYVCTHVRTHACMRMCVYRNQGFLRNCNNYFGVYRSTNTSAGTRLPVPLASYGSFRKLGVPYLGARIIRILLLGYYIRVPYFRKLPYATDLEQTLRLSKPTSVPSDNERAAGFTKLKYLSGLHL